MMRVVRNGVPITARIWDGDGWRDAWTGGSSSLVVTPPEGPLRNIAVGGSLLNSTATVTGAGAMVHTTMPILVDAANPILELDLSFTSGSIADTTLRIAVATTAQPEPRAVTFDGGQLEKVVTSPNFGADTSASNEQVVTVASDPLPIDISGGDTLTVYGWASGPATIVADSNNLAATPMTYGTFAQAINSQPTVAGYARGIRPSRLIAPSDKPAWVLAGDSIVHQWYCHLDMFARHFGLAHAKHARGGAGTATDISNYAHRFRGNPYATHLIDQLGVNRWVMQEQVDLWRMHRESGLQALVKLTLPPRATSTDGYATLANQTAVFSSGAMRAWLMDGAPVSSDWLTALPTGTTDADAVRCKTVNNSGALTAGMGVHPCGDGGVIDAGGVVRSTVDPDKFAVGIGLAPADYGDGVHYGAAIHRLIADRLIRDVPTLLAGTSWR